MVATPLLIVVTVPLKPETADVIEFMLVVIVPIELVRVAVLPFIAIIVALSAASVV